jgi:3-oxoacyl-[acyl-carrier-protein] synthase-3
MSGQCVVRSLGAYLPARRVTNHELPAHLETSDAWIQERTGIVARHLAAEGELTSDLATAAANDALMQAGLQPDDLDMLIVATATPDDTMPSTAVSVQAKLGVSRPIAAFDVHAVCSGFIYALAMADSAIKNGLARRAMIIGAETFSRVLDWNDRGTCVLFGDGAGALILEASEQNDRGIIASRLHADGHQREILMTTGGTSRTGTAGVLTMQGREVFRHAVQKMSDSLREVLSAQGLDFNALDWLVPHQANRRILEAIADKTGIAPERMVMTLDQHANTSAASIPLALHHAQKNQWLKPGNMVGLVALGAGLTWGSCLIKW